MTTCSVCNEQVETVLDCGMQPVSNRFVKSEDETEALFPLALGVCSTCGLVQLSKRFPQQELIPKYNWIRYAEPEEHVEVLAHIIAGLKEKRVLGISPKEDSTIEKLRAKGFQAYRLTEDDLGCPLGSESIQKALSERADDIVKKHGTFSIVIARQIFEHTYNPAAFIGALKKLTTQDGMLVIEVPDSTKQLETLDYGMLWEEHTMYFTQATLRNTLARNGLKIEQFIVYPYATEPSIIAIAQKGQENFVAIAGETERAQQYGQLFQQRRAEVREYFAEHRKQGKIAFFGAGHMACMLLNMFSLRDFTDIIIDDSKDKKGLFMPLSHIKIIDSSHIGNEIKTIVLTVNPNSEEKIIARISSFHGNIVSLCPNSSRALIQWEKKNPEVYYSKQWLPMVSKREIELLKEKARTTERQRSRLCTHTNENETLHEMFIIHQHDTYVRPHKHLKKIESLHVIEGTATVVLFDDNGNVTKKIHLGDYHSGYQFYYRLNTPTYHMLIIRSETLVFIEAATGPFDKNETVFPSWAPEEGDTEVQQFMEKVKS